MIFLPVFAIVIAAIAFTGVRSVAAERRRGDITVTGSAPSPERPIP